jgi:hypothetical protein
MLLCVINQGSVGIVSRKFSVCLVNLRYFYSAHTVTVAENPGVSVIRVNLDVKIAAAVLGWFTSSSAGAWVRVTFITTVIHTLIIRFFQAFRKK